MKYVDYYKVLGVDRNASQADIKKAYRKLAHEHHPDVASHKGAEDRFKDIAEAYATLKDPEKRSAYDALGSRPQGEEFVPPHEWREYFHESPSDFADVDLADLLSAFASARHGGGRERHPHRMHGQDFDIEVPVTLEQIYHGAETEISVVLPEYDAQGLLHRTPKTYRVHIPKGASDGQRMRLSGRGGAGYNGGRPGDLYISMRFKPHDMYRVEGTDLYTELPLTPWEAALGAPVQIPTLGGPVEMTIPPGTATGRKLRLARRGLPGSTGEHGDLYATVKIVVPRKLTERERELYTQLAKASSFNPRAPMNTGARS